MILCDGCGSMIDAKGNGLDGVFEHKAPFRYWCPECVSDGTNPYMMEALRVTDPERYEEVKESRE